MAATEKANVVAKTAGTTVRSPDGTALAITADTEAVAMAENVQTATVKTLGNMAVTGAATLAKATTMTDDAVGDAVGTSSSGVLVMSVRTVTAASEAAVAAKDSTAAAVDEALPDVPVTTAETMTAADTAAAMMNGTIRETRLATETALHDTAERRSPVTVEATLTGDETAATAMASITTMPSTTTTETVNTLAPTTIAVTLPETTGTTGTLGGATTETGMARPQPRKRRERRPRTTPATAPRRSARIREQGQKRVRFIDEQSPVDAEVLTADENAPLPAAVTVDDGDPTDDDAMPTAPASETTRASLSEEPVAHDTTADDEVANSDLATTTGITVTTRATNSTTAARAKTPAVTTRRPTQQAATTTNAAPSAERTSYDTGLLTQDAAGAATAGGNPATPKAVHAPVQPANDQATRMTTTTAPATRRATMREPEVRSRALANGGVGVGEEDSTNTSANATTSNTRAVARLPMNTTMNTSRRSDTSASPATTPTAVTTNDLEGENDVPTDGTLQLSDKEIIDAQNASKFVKRTLDAGAYRGMQVKVKFGLAVIATKNGWRVLLPPTIWAPVFKEMHGSIWSGHLRGPHTYGRVAHLYWWPKLQREVNRWIRGCPECGSRKARPREVIPPLRSIGGGDVGDRWALDVAGPFPVASGGERYVVAALEYVTRYAVACCVSQHTAEDIAKFLMEEVVLKFGVFRELLTDGAPEMTGNVIDELVNMLQAKQINPVPYRPQMIGLVERFHRTWKDCVSVFMQDESQKDWNLWVKFAAYAYNSAQHSTVKLSPNELMMGRKLRAPNELLRRTEVTEGGKLSEYHEKLLEALERSRRCAEIARVREQERQAKFYNRNTRKRREFRAGDRVWLYQPPRGPRATKFVHQWVGPLRILEPAGYENYLLKREDGLGQEETLIAHFSFLTSYYEPTSPLSQIGNDIDEQLHEERNEQHEETPAAVVRTATAATGRQPPDRGTKRNQGAVASTADDDGTSGCLVERRRRRRRNRAGQYALEYELFPTGDVRKWTTGDREQWTTRNGRPRSRWVSIAEYEQLYCAGRVVEDPWREEVV
ncbi:hypothetical protein DVH05_028627 [Phytophthora capsici]|nr:hypothetical protein DVH05_028627 [Phytophthora capsici]